MTYIFEEISLRDKKTRLQAYSNLYNSTDVRNKNKTLIEGLNDKHDSIRSSIIEYLTNIYISQPDFDLLEIFISQLEKENFWVVKFLILKKINKMKFSNLNSFKGRFIPYLNNLKPQIRLISAEVLSSLNISDQDDIIVKGLLDCWRKEKDSDTRLKLDQLLSDSEHPIIIEELKIHNKKVADKEKRKKEVVGMFEGI